MIVPAQQIMIVVSVIGVLSILVALALFIHHVIKREHAIQEKERAGFKEYEQIIKKAHDEAAALLEKAAETSKTLVAQTKTTNEHLKTDVDQALQAIADKEIAALTAEADTFRKDYETKINQMEQSVDKNTATILQTTNTNVQKQLETFNQQIASHALQSEQSMTQKTQEMLQKVEEDLTEYKKTKLAKIDTEVLALLEKTYKDVLGKTIPPTINRELIIESLERSKKEGLFNS